MDLSLGRTTAPKILWVMAATGSSNGISAAVQRTEIGIASTLMALPPVIVLPISYFAFKEKFGWQAVAGTVLAIAGVAILFLA